MGNNDETRLNPSLKRVIYWGSVDPAHEVFNQGDPTPNDINYPIWVEPDCFYVVTNHFYENRFIPGLYRIEIDPISFQFRSFVAFEWPSHVWDIAFDSSAGNFKAIIGMHGEYEGVSLRLNDSLVVEEQIIEPSWAPNGISAYPKTEGIVFYGRRPSTGVAGFYWRRAGPEGAIVDSLLHRADLDPEEARGIAIGPAGRYLYYAQGSESRVRFFKVDLTGAEGPLVIADRKGGLGEIRPNPVNDLILIGYRFGGNATDPPRSHIELLDVRRSQSRDLDVRTVPRGFIQNEHFHWSPDGRHFLFSAWMTSGERERSIKDIWVYRDVP